MSFSNNASTSNAATETATPATCTREEALEYLNTLPKFVEAPVEIQNAMTKIYMASPSPWPNDWVRNSSPNPIPTQSNPTKN
jgi:hypothetical protein